MTKHIRSGLDSDLSAFLASCRVMCHNQATDRPTARFVHAYSSDLEMDTD